MRIFISIDDTDDVVDSDGNSLPKDSTIIFSDSRLKTVLLDHTQVIPAILTGKNGSTSW